MSADIEQPVEEYVKQAYGGAKWMSPNGTLWMWWVLRIFGREWHIQISTPKWTKGNA